MRPTITKLLVATRGESARRVMRTARDMGIATVAVFSEADRQAPFVADADEAVALDRFSERGPGAYLDSAAIVEAARRAGADALHPGYGLRPADAGLAWRCAEAGLIFVGPPPETVAVLSSRLEAKTLAAGAGVPVLDAEEVDGYPPGKLEAAADVLGWPVAVQAAAGGGCGGGRALRVVGEIDDLAGAVEAVRREATATFGDGTVFLEAWPEPARPVSVQVFADSAGRVVHLFERDCSVGRGHRAVIVEAPAPKLAQPVRERLAAAAVAVAEAAGFVGAGTVEFLVTGEQIWFAGMTSRLDADHAVTEAILGIDLVRMQLAVAEGRALPVEARHCSPSGHAVAARVCAEEAGRLRRFDAGPAPGVQVESGVVPGMTIDPAVDGSLATLIAHATSRGEALRRLAAALAGLRIHGVRTNRDELVAALRHPELRAGAVDTAFLDRHRDALAAAHGGAEALRLHAVAAALALAGGSPAGSAVFSVASGDRVSVEYRTGGAGPLTDVSVDGVALPAVHVEDVGAQQVDLEVDGLRRRVHVARTGDVVDCDSALGHTELVLHRLCTEP